MLGSPIALHNLGVAVPRISQFISGSSAAWSRSHTGAHKYRRLLGIAVMTTFGCLPAFQGPARSAEPELLHWSQLPPLPDPEGFAYPFAGVDDGALIVAGGTNFPELRPWEGGAKVWYDSVYVLRPGDKSWRTGLKLPRPIGYGVSLTTPDGIACLGGSDADRHYADCFLLQSRQGQLHTKPLPSLPTPCANFCGSMVGSTIYVAGGIARPDATTALHTFWSLDLTRLEDGWQELEPWPGPERMLATAGAKGGAFFLFGGAALETKSNEAPIRNWLRDAYCFTPGSGWKRIADLPRAAVAAPTPAPAVGQSHLLILGGDDGTQIDASPTEHHGFPRDVLAYHTITNTWTKFGELPFSLVTTPAVAWRDQIVVPGGERLPGIRSNQVWAAEVSSQRAAFGWINYSALVTYLLAMVGIGWYCAKRNRSTEDFFKASGRIPWWAAGMSIYATMLSSLTFMAVPAKAYATDWTFFWANVPILLLAPLVIHFYLPFFRQLNVTSAYEYLEQRFNLATRLYASAAFILFQLGRQAIVLLLPSLALATVSDLDVRTCVVLMGVLCVIYTAMGGIEAVIWTDVVQTVVLLTAAIVTLVLILLSTDGGLGGLWSTAIEEGKLHMFNWTLEPTTVANAFWVILVGNLFVNLIPYTSDQTVVQRYMTTKDEATAGRAIWTNALMAIPSTMLFFAIGTALFAFYRNHPEQLNPARSTDAVFPAFIVENLPVGAAGLVIAGIFAAAQSTVSSSLNSVVTAMMTDFYGRFGGRVADARGLRIARWLTVINGIFATLAALALAELNKASLWDTYFNLVGLAGSGLAGLFALGIFTRRANGVSALAGALASAAVLYWVQQHTQIHFFLYAGIGIATCFVVGWLVGVCVPVAGKSLVGLTIYDGNPQQEVA
jgi:solute:Na+ symporter, SSS family